MDAPISELEEEVTETDSPIREIKNSPTIKSSKPEIIEKFEYKSVITTQKPRVPQPIYKRRNQSRSCSKILDRLQTQIISKITQSNPLEEEITANNLQAFISTSAERRVVDPNDFSR
jgi:hypothetical protein